MQQLARHDDLDPRRRLRSRAGAGRDWASMSRTISVARLHELLVTALVRVGLVR